VFKEIIPGYRTVGYVEIKTYCRDIIRARIRDGILDDAPIFDDILTFNSQFAKMYAGKVDFISGGFPCTPFSVAGLRLGAADERNMWPATRDAISIIRPRYILLENVPGLFVHGYIRRIFGDLAEMRYDCEWDVVGASDVGVGRGCTTQAETGVDIGPRHAAAKPRTRKWNHGASEKRQAKCQPHH
jgi:DNA (cytosine-5)-methyltransferase 1